ncbi:11404_t:CDS:2, partial [Cetraspora pellucida]
VILWNNVAKGYNPTVPFKAPFVLDSLVRSLELFVLGYSKGGVSYTKQCCDGDFRQTIVKELEAHRGHRIICERPSLAPLLMYSMCKDCFDSAKGYTF